MTRLLVLFLLVLSMPPQVLAGDIYRGLDAGDVFVATIVRVEDKDATNAKPPTVWLEVHEVLRGDGKAARSPAIWSPHWHGIDWGGAEKELEKWSAQPMKGPKVGEKFILGGRAIGKQENKDTPQYDLYAFIRLPYTDKARQQTIDQLKLLEELRRQYEAELAAAAQDKQRRADKWRAAMTDKVIDDRTRQADAVAIGKIVSGSTFEIETMLKGRPRTLAGGVYYVCLPKDGFDKRIVDIVYDRGRCVLFLSEENLVASVREANTTLIDPYEGIVLVDDAAVGAVKASLEKHPPPPPRPVLVISALTRDEALPLARAAKDRFEVVLSHQFSGHGDQAVAHVRKTIPFARYLVMIDRGPGPRSVSGIQINPTDSETLYEQSWPEKIAPEHLQAILRALGATIEK